MPQRALVLSLLRFPSDKSCPLPPPTFPQSPLHPLHALQIGRPAISTELSSHFLSDTPFVQYQPEDQSHRAVGGPKDQIRRYAEVEY